MISCSHWGMVEEILCKHSRTQGSGSAMLDGSGHSEWICMDCGESRRMDYPPTTTQYQRLNFGRLD